MRQVRLTGTVILGRGLGAPRMTDPGVLEDLRDLLGFPPVPGTLNVRLLEPVDRSLLTRYLSAGDIRPEWEDETGQAGYLFAPVLVSDQYQGIAFQADEPGYPPDQVELVCDVHIRNTLGLSDGDPIVFSVLG